MNEGGSYFQNLFANAAGKFSIGKLIFAGIVVAAVVFLFWLLKRFFKRYKNPTDPTLKSKSTIMLILYSILRFAVVVIAVLIILDLFGVNISGAIAGLGIAGAAGALAVQDLLKDVIMGATLVSDQYFKVGDIVNYKDSIGKVIEITMRTTKIEVIKDKSIFSIRNSNITEVSILSHVMNMFVPLPYDLPVKEAYDVLEKIAEKCRALEPVERAVVKGPQTFKDSSIEYLIVIFCDPADYLNTKRAVNTAILQGLEEQGVHIPFPQADIHIKN